MKVKILKVLKWIAITGGALYILLVLIRIPSWWGEQKTAEQVAKIHATKLTIDDVMGKNLPPDPGLEADKTIAGVDANKNGIRDDVELAIFKEYPEQAKFRSAFLQYALGMQTQMTLALVNKDTITATVEDLNSRADNCVRTLSSRDDIKKFSADMQKYRGYVEGLQLNNEKRKKYLDSIYEYINGASFSNGGCDIDPKTLPN